MSRPASPATSRAITLRHLHRVAPALRALCRARRNGGDAFRPRRNGAARVNAGRAVALMTQRPTPLSVLLSAAERALAAELEEGLRVGGFTDLRAAHAQVFVAMDVEGSRLTDLAARAGMT